MNDVRTCLKRGADRLAAAGIDNPWREARLLLAQATGLGETILIGYPERRIGDCDAFTGLVDRRAAREPMSHLLGRHEFWSLQFEVTADTLDPRPDSETIIEAAVDSMPRDEDAFRILDLGTGTGCLLAALLTVFPAAWGVGVDRSPATASVAVRNFDRLGMPDRARVIVADWGAALDGAFDLIVANPPYIPTEEINSLQPEVAKYDPILALDGGMDGLDAFRRLMSGLPKLLAEHGVAIVEFGDGQSASVGRIAESAGLRIRDVRADLAGRPRCLVCG